MCESPLLFRGFSAHNPALAEPLDAPRGTTAQRRHSRHSCSCQLIRNSSPTRFHRYPPSMPHRLPEAHPQHADVHNNARPILSLSQAPKRARDVQSLLGTRSGLGSSCQDLQGAPRTPGARPLYSRPWRGSVLPYRTSPRRQTRTACSTLISSRLFVSTRTWPLTLRLVQRACADIMRRLRRSLATAFAFLGSSPLCRRRAENFHLRQAKLAGISRREVCSVLDRSRERPPSPHALGARPWKEAH